MPTTKPNYPADPSLQDASPTSSTPPDSNEPSSTQESSMRELRSLAQSLLAESGMARLSAVQWADLKRCARVDYRRGALKITSPDRPESQPQIVRLEWQPGAMLLAESYGPDAPTLSLPLPPVRGSWEWAVPPATGLPPPPGPKGQWDSPELTTARDRANEARRAGWRQHLAPILVQAEQTMAAEQTQTQADEETLAVAAMRAVQNRRLDPMGAEQTLAQELEEIAAGLRE